MALLPQRTPSPDRLLGPRDVGLGYRRCPGQQNQHLSPSQTACE